MAWAANIDDFNVFNLLADNGRPLQRGRLYVPPEAAGPAARPLILFLHGAGEQGIDNMRQVIQNIDNLLAEAKQRGAFLYAPQTNIGWSELVLTERAHLQEIHFLWRPFLSDADDDMVLELALAAGCQYIITHNVTDFHGSEQQLGVTALVLVGI